MSFQGSVIYTPLSAYLCFLCPTDQHDSLDQASILWEGLPWYRQSFGWHRCCSTTRLVIIPLIIFPHLTFDLDLLPAIEITAVIDILCPRTMEKLWHGNKLLQKSRCVIISKCRRGGLCSRCPSQWTWMYQTCLRSASSSQLLPSALCLSCQPWGKKEYSIWTKSHNTMEFYWTNYNMQFGWLQQSLIKTDIVKKSVMPKYRLWHSYDMSSISV